MENFEDLDKPSIEFKNLIKIVQLAPQQWIIQVKICVCRGKNGAYLVYFPCILFVSWAASICPSLQVHSGSTGLSDNSAFVSLHSQKKWNTMIDIMHLSWKHLNNYENHLLPVTYPNSFQFQATNGNCSHWWCKKKHH